jgi:hypothetical protein
MTYLINNIQATIIIHIEKIIPDQIEESYYNSIIKQKFFESQKHKHKRTRLQNAIQAFPEEALMFAIENQDQRLLSILRPSKSAISETHINIAREIEIEQILNSENISHKNHRSACPLCDSDNPTSLSFKNNLFHCFKCNEKGDSITFIQKLKQITFPQSIQYLNSL